MAKVGHKGCQQLEANPISSIIHLFSSVSPSFCWHVFYKVVMAEFPVVTGLLPFGLVTDIQCAELVCSLVSRRSRIHGNFDATNIHGNNHRRTVA